MTAMIAGKALSVTVFALLIGAAGAADRANLRLKSEPFDRDPGWTGVNNLVDQRGPYKRQQYGYQRQRKHGRIGGRVWRSRRSEYYGMRMAEKSFETPLSASGTIEMTQAKTTVGYQNGSTIFFGFFNHAERGWRPINFIGFRLEGYNEPDGATIELSYGTRAWTAGGSFVNAKGGTQERKIRDLDNRSLLRIAPDGKIHRWSLEYDPKAGSGLITFKIDGITSTHALRPDHRAQGATMDRFGMFNAELPGNEMTAYLDELTVNGKGLDLSRDPQWDGDPGYIGRDEHDGYGANSFRFRHYPIQGVRGTIGGVFWRVQEPEYKGHYGGDIGRLTMDDPLYAAGRISIPRFCIDSGMHFGWFNSREQGWPPKNFIGVYLDSLSSAGRFITPMYGTSKARRERVDGRYRLFGASHGAEDVLFSPDGRWYEWALKYDPAASDGNGAITLSLGDRTQTVALAPGARKEGTVMDRFGLFNMQDNNGKDCVVYLDGLRYTTARPETPK